ncbi:MAG: HD domain-containing protein [Deltaproteobacteria bacterium]|nr:HD domain-containing protein [Deltaproteobacteria bacterium]
MNSPRLPHFPFIDELIRRGGEVYLVGGNVRDHFLKIEHNDYDLLVRKIPYAVLVDLLKKRGKTATVGKTFGVIKFTPEQTGVPAFDIALPRIEKSTGAGHRDFQVDFDPELAVERDLARRDFTINAMALNLATEELVDPFGGKKDLEGRILRQVFLEAFVEDPLRLMRGVQFTARFELKPDPGTLDAMKKHAPLISTVSRERIIEEIRKLLLARYPSIGFDLMRETGLLPIVFPFVDRMIGVLQPMKENEDVYLHTMKVLDAARSCPDLDEPGNMDIMFSALLHDAGKPATRGYDPVKKQTTFYSHQLVSKKIARRWLNEFKATCIGLDIDRILNLVENHMFETKHYYTDRAIRRFINKIGPDNIFRLIDLRIADRQGGKFPRSLKGVYRLREKIREELEKKPPFGPRDLAVNGHDIMKLGFKAGPIIGKIQKFLVEKVLDEPELNEKEKLIELIKKNFPHEKKEN